MSAVTVIRGALVPEVPRVSVVIPAFGPAWLEDALESVRAQTLREHEIIVVDDGSSTPVVPRRTADLIMVRHPNAGPGGARNRGFALARGEFVAMVDSDDRWRPSKLAKQVAFLEQRPACVLSTTNWGYFDEGKGGPVVPRFNSASRPDDTIPLGRLFLENCICCSTAMVRRDALLKTPGMAPERRLGEDYGLWLRLAMVGTIGYLDDVLVERRLHPSSLMHAAARDGSWFADELATYEEFLNRYPELQHEPFVRAAFGRLYFQRSYHHRSRQEWAAARRAAVRSLRYAPRHGKAWVDLARALLHWSGHPPDQSPAH